MKRLIGIIMASIILASAAQAADCIATCSWDGIHVVSYRHRLADADGISAKAAIDGLIHAGILRDDSPEFVKEVSYSQVKVSGKEMERTEIQIEALPGPAKEVAAPAKGGGTLRPPAG